MTKAQMIAATVQLMAPRDAEERNRLSRHLATRTLPQVAESLARWRAIANVKKSEVNRHCQTEGLPRIGR